MVIISRVTIGSQLAASLSAWRSGMLAILYFAAY